MENYRSNPRCECARCRMAGLMGPAVLITLGAIFLLDNLDAFNGAFTFHNTWPVLLIVIGIVKVLQYMAPVENHVPRYAPTTPPPTHTGSLPPGAQPPATTGGEEAQNV